MRLYLAGAALLGALVTGACDSTGETREVGSVVIISGDSQTVAPATALPNRIVAEVRDDRDRAIPYAHVAWEIRQLLSDGSTVPGGSIIDAFASADRSGRVDGAFAVGAAPGTYRIEVLAAIRTDTAGTQHRISVMAHAFAEDPDPQD